MCKSNKENSKIWKRKSNIFYIVVFKNGGTPAITTSDECWHTVDSTSLTILPIQITVPLPNGLSKVADGYQRIYEDVKIEQTEDKKQEESNIEEILIVVSMLGATGTIKFSKKR